jgi:predicted Zn finger-like uncharacterized protein
MKIHCPACQLTGSVNELELPSEGRELTCPRCKKSFHVDRPPVDADLRPMNVCPACQYATFSEEMFVVCPKCGMTEKEGREKRHRQDLERLRSDQEALHRTYRNLDLVTAAPEEPATDPAAAPQPVRVTGWLCIAVGSALFCYGGYDLANYYARDWQAILSAPLLEPLSRTRVFFRLGFLPWVTTLFGLVLASVAGQFLRRAPWGRKGLALCAWTGLVVVLIHQAAGLVAWLGTAASSTGVSYYLAGILNALLMTALWGAPFILLRWFLEHDMILQEFPEE